MGVTGTGTRLPFDPPPAMLLATSSQLSQATSRIGQVGARGRVGGRQGADPNPFAVDASDDEWEDAPPDPGATIESLRSLGYSTAAALADLIDNSIAVKASLIVITFELHPRGDSWCAIVDDGDGMTEDELMRAMTVGGTDPLDARSDRDLGRFGFGLKTASFSQARELTVASRATRNGAFAVRSWDIDEVRRRRRWTLRKRAPAGAKAILTAVAPKGRGTVVLWRRLDGFPGVDEKNLEAGRKLANEHLGQCCDHLGMVFARYIQSGSLTVRVNRKQVAPWDPFLADNAATQELPTEKLSLNSTVATVVPYVLPHESKLTPVEVDTAGGPAGWNEQQGFYVFRRDRLITAGDWLGLGFSRDDLHNLARIKLDIPAEMDGEWQLDITKATVRPPAALKADLKRIADGVRKRAASVKRHRGGVVGGRKAPSHIQVWTQRTQHGEPRLTINRKHPMIVNLLEGSGAQRRTLSDALHLIEQTIPVLLLPATPVDRTPFEDDPPEELIRLAEVVYDALLSQDMTRSEALQRLLNTEPFYLYPVIKEHFDG
jgi:hypothetical protein